MKKNRDPKKHHYVPQFLLRRFSSPPREDEKAKIFWYDKQKRVCKHTTIKDVAFTNDFYTYIADGKTINLENDLFANLDYEASKVLREICNTKVVPKDDIKTHRLLFFLAAQFLRVPRKREDWIRVVRDIEYQLGSGYPFGSVNCPVGSVGMENIKKWSLTDFREKCEYLESGLRGKKIILIDNESDMPFIISDNPLFLIFPDEIYDINSIPGDILLPLTPHLALCVYSTERESKINAMRKQIAFMNNIYQIQEAERFVFSDDGKLLDRMCKTYDIFEHPCLLFEGQALELLKSISVQHGGEYSPC